MNQFFDTRLAVLVGHWQKDSGAVDPKDQSEHDELDTREADLTLRLSRAVKERAAHVLAEVKLIGGSLANRVRSINDMQAHLAIAIHANSGPPAARGHEVLVNPAKHERNQELADIMDRCLDRFVPNPDRGVKTRTDLYVLNGSTVPTVLIEPGFISNPAEEQWLWSSAACDAIADSVLLTTAVFRSRTA